MKQLTMKIVPWYASNEILAVGLATALAVLGWMATQIIDIKTHVAVLEANQQRHMALINPQATTTNILP